MNWKLAYSTLGCPAWTLEQAVAEAGRLGYDGLELRLLDGEVIEPDLAMATRKRVAGLLRASGLGLAAVDSSVRLVADRPEADIESDIRAFLELAVEWSAPVVRVFGGEVPAGTTDERAVERAAAILNRIAPEAERLGVGVAIETHDAFASAVALAGILKHVPSASVGAIWDILHTYRLGESPEQAWAAIGGRVFSVHVKDAVRQGGGWQLVPLGQGEVPGRECLAVLRRGGYQGWLVVEWEKKWHPEIADPEVALPHEKYVLAGWLAEEAGVR
jgi:fatty-acyl-CoA synthase